MKEPKVQVGILFEPQIEFVLLNPYRMDGTEVSGKQVVTYDEGKILWNGRRYDELLFEPQHEQTDAFELLDVTIGINFHWERKEDQRFLGALKIIVENGKAHRHQRHPCRRLSDQRHLLRDECHRFSGAAQGTRCHLPKLATGTNTKE